MDEYRIVYTCIDGYEDEVVVCAVNRIMAMELFEDFEIEDVVDIECYRIVDEEDSEDDV